MKKLISILFFLIFLLLAGCASLPWNETREERIESTQIQLALNERDLQENSRQLTTAIVEAQEGEIEPNERDILILELSKLDQQIEGLPIERIDVESLLETIRNDRESFDEQMTAVRVSTAELQRANQGLNIEIETLRQQLEVEKNKSWIDHLFSWFFGLSIPVIIVVILLIVFFPAIGIPMLTSVINWLIGTVPQLIGFFGVVSKKLVDATTQGIQEVRNDWKNDTEGTIKKGEALKLLDASLSSKMDRVDKKIISERKLKLGLK